MHRRLFTLLAGFAVLAGACGDDGPVIQAPQASTQTSAPATDTTPPEEAAESDDITTEPENEPVETTPIAELRVGDCSDTADINLSAGAVSLVDCSEPHRYEVFADVLMADVELTDETGAAIDPNTALAAACDELAAADSGLRLDTATVSIIAVPATTPDGIARCLYEAPDQRTEIFAVAPFANDDVEVAKRLLPGSSDTTFQVATSVVTDGDQLVIVTGPDNSTDTSGTGANDVAVWRSTDGGRIFNRSTDASIAFVAGNQVANRIGAFETGFLIAGVDYTRDDPQPFAVYGDVTGTAWNQVSVPLGVGNIGADLHSVIERPDGTVEVIGIVFNARGLRRPMVWTWGGISLSAPSPIENGDDAGTLSTDQFLETVNIERGVVTVQLTDLLTNRRSAWVSSEPGEWESVATTGFLQVSTAVADDGHYAVRGEGVAFQAGAGQAWQSIGLPTHDGGTPTPAVVASNGADVLVAGTMTSVRGAAAAMWLKQGDGDFELVFFDTDAAQHGETIADAAVVDGGFVVVGRERPEPEIGSTDNAVVWMITAAG